jgi:hypothetical protein
MAAAMPIKIKSQKGRREKTNNGRKYILRNPSILLKDVKEIPYK